MRGDGTIMGQIQQSGGVAICQNYSPTCHLNSRSISGLFPFIFPKLSCSYFTEYQHIDQTQVVQPSHTTQDCHRILSSTLTRAWARKSLFTRPNTEVCVFKDLITANKKTKKPPYVSSQGHFIQIQFNRNPGWSLWQDKMYSFSRQMGKKSSKW